MTILAPQIVSDIRQLSSLFNNNLFSDQQVVKLFNDGASELYDWAVGTFETWFLDHVDFTLAGGVGQNVFAMPMDKLLKDNTLEMNPTNNRPVPIPRLGSWSDRNNVGTFGTTYAPGSGRRYYPAGSNLMIFPPDLSAGSYRLWYTPKYIPIALQIPIPPAVPGTPASITTVSPGGVYAFTGAAWSSVNVGDTVIISGASNSVNNGTFTILNVLTPDSITTSNSASVGEGAGATLVDQPVGTTNAFSVAMEPWVLYPEIHASISIRNSRQQDVSDMIPKLAALKQRVETAMANRTQEVPQTPLRDIGGPWGNWYGGGG